MDGLEAHPTSKNEILEKLEVPYVAITLLMLSVGKSWFISKSIIFKNVGIVISYDGKILES